MQACGVFGRLINVDECLVAVVPAHTLGVLDLGDLPLMHDDLHNAEAKRTDRLANQLKPAVISGGFSMECGLGSLAHRVRRGGRFDALVRSWLQARAMALPEGFSAGCFGHRGAFISAIAGTISDLNGAIPTLLKSWRPAGSTRASEIQITPRAPLKAVLLTPSANGRVRS